MSTDSKPSAGAPARLVGFKFKADAQLPPPLHTLGLVDVTRPPGPLVGWGLSVRGAVVFLVSPRGWVQGQPPASWSPTGEHTLLGPIPMASVTLIWKGPSPDVVDKLQRYDLPAMSPPGPQVDETAALDSKEVGDP